MKPYLSTMKLLLWAVFFEMVPLAAFSQAHVVTGKLVDVHDSIVPAASVMLMHRTDTSFVKGVVSDMDGAFSFSGVAQGNYLVFVQHMLYERQSIPIAVQGTVNLGRIVLMEKENELGEISVKAVRPVVKMKDNVLSYDAAAVSEKFVRSNALEVLGDVPGVLLKDGSVQLVGAGQLTIAINGKPTTLSLDQVVKMLESMPNSSVKEVQVMYAPPAKFHVKGSLINIVLKQAASDQLNGSVMGGYKQRKYAGGNGGFNLQYAKGKWETGLLYNGNYGHPARGYDIDIDHMYHDTLYAIKQNMYFPSETFVHDIQFNTSFSPSEQHRLSLFYTGNFEDTDGDHDTYALFNSVKDAWVETNHSNIDGKERMHNVKLDYSLGTSLNVGVDYTYFKDPSTTDYDSDVDGTSILYKTESGQTVNKWMGYFDHTVKWDEAWSVNYGANYSSIGNDNYYRYYDHDGGGYVQDAGQSSANTYTESATSAFAGLSGNLSPKLSFNVSLKGELDKMVKDTLDSDRTLWNDFRFYPSLNMTFVADSSSNHMFQLALQSYATYPTYWQVSPATWYTNQYMLGKGNPELKPSQTYESSLNYIFRRKYVLVLSYRHTSRMIDQIPMASEETFNTVARNENLDYESVMSSALVLPFSLGSSVEFNPTLGFFRRKMKREDVGAESFNRAGNTFFAELESAVLLSKKHNVKFNLSGYWYDGVLQSIYDVDGLYDVSLGLSCSLFKDQATFAVKVKDIFDSNSPVSSINFNNQQSVYKSYLDSRMLTVDFRYNFGKPLKEKKVKVDTSRFQRMQ
ncbi:MAG: outer membrane beta-barrel family protein [Breznakibacter sp.]